jgi:hypothetical protein
VARGERLIKAADSSFFVKGIKVPPCGPTGGRVIITMGGESLPIMLRLRRTGKGRNRGETPGEKLRGVKTETAETQR